MCPISLHRSVEGIEDARDLLADWLVNCVSRYTINMYEREGELIPEDFGPDDVLARMDLYTQVTMSL